MKNTKGEKFQQIIGKSRMEEEFEKKYFPRSHKKKKQEKAMEDPKIFEEQLKEKLRKCLGSVEFLKGNVDIQS